MCAERGDAISQMEYKEESNKAEILCDRCDEQRLQPDGRPCVVEGKYRPTVRHTMLQLMMKCHRTRYIATQQITVPQKGTVTGKDIVPQDKVYMIRYHRTGYSATKSHKTGYSATKKATGQGMVPQNWALCHRRGYRARAEESTVGVGGVWRVINKG